jgi:CHAD domain-containing protein
MPLHPELLDRPPSEGARTVVLAFLAEARERAGRMGDPGDEEALHDFRVSVRRLRSALRAWREVLGGGVRDKDLRRLRRVARATGDARDAEVLLAWIAGAAEAFPPSHRAAAEWLSRRLAPQAGRSDLSSTVERFVEAADSLSRRLKHERPPPSRETFGEAIAARIRAQVAAVASWLSQVETPADAPLAHRARIEGKRLRYLLEPLRDTPGADAAGAVKALKRFQDVLGELNDALVAGEVIRAARHDAEAERLREEEPGHGPGLRPGLLALELGAERRAAAAYAQLRQDVLSGEGSAPLDPALAVAEALVANAARHEPESPESRHLLHSLPPGAKEWPDPVEEEAGWLPDSAGREGFRLLRSGAGDRFFREVASGSGTRRGAVREPVDAATFAAYWPLTEGRRLRRVSRNDPSGSGWRVDEYLDRALALAVGPADAGTPGWLEQVRVRDVSGERAYRDEVIARRARRT